MRRALLLLVLLAPMVACGSDDDDGKTAASSTTSTTVEPTTTSAPAGLTLGAPVDLDGFFVGVHPTAPIAYVSIIVPGEVGCEGGDVAHLWAQPLTGGPPVQVVPSGFESGVVVGGGADGRVAIVDSCEGFLSKLTTARPAADGTFEDVHEIDTTAAQEQGQLQPGTIRWGADGQSFVALVHDQEGDGSRIVRISLDGTIDELGHGDGLLAVEELQDGTLVVARPTSITAGDDAPIETSVTSLALRPDRSAVAVLGDDAIRLYESNAENLVALTSKGASVGSWSADGESMAYLHLVGDDASARLVRGATDIEVSPNAGFAAPAISGDGAFVVYNEAVDSGQGFDEPRARARSIS